MLRSPSMDCPFPSFSGAIFPGASIQKKCTHKQCAGLVIDISFVTSRSGCRHGIAGPYEGQIFYHKKNTSIFFCTFVPSGECRGAPSPVILVEAPVSQ